MMDEFLTCVTLELVEIRTKTTRNMLSFISQYSDWCLRSNAAKGAPTHFCSTFNACINNRFKVLPKVVIDRRSCLKHFINASWEKLWAQNADIDGSLERIHKNNYYLYPDLVKFMLISEYRIHIDMFKLYNYDCCVIWWLTCIYILQSITKSDKGVLVKKDFPSNYSKLNYKFSYNYYGIKIMNSGKKGEKRMWEKHHRLGGLVLTH